MQENILDGLIDSKTEKILRLCKTNIVEHLSTGQRPDGITVFNDLLKSNQHLLSCS